MTKAYYDACPSLAKLPKLKSCQEHCLVGNGQRVAILFTIPVLISFVGHTFEINTQVTTPLMYEIFVIGMKSLTEMEAVMDTRNCEVHFLNRPAPVYPLKETIILPKQFLNIHAYLKFPSSVTGMVILKLTTYCRGIVTAKVVVHRNMCVLRIQNTDDTPLKMPDDIPLGFADARSVGFYHVSNNVLKDQLGKAYSFCPINCFQDCMNMLSSQIENSFKPRTKNGVTDPYPWLEKTDPRRSMSDEEILIQTIDLSKSALS